MAYYDAQAASDRYYSPEQNTTQQETDIGPILRTMGAAIALNVVGGVVTRHLVNSSKNTLKSWANSKSVIRKSIADKTISTYSSFKRATEPIRSSIVNNSVYKAGQERKTLLKATEGTSGYGIKRVTSAFKNTKTFAATIGGVWKKNVLDGMAVAYGVDSLLGFTRETGLEKKKIYDIPGQASNFAKWLGYSSAGGLAFGVAGPTLGVIGAVGLKSLQKVFAGEFGKQVLDFAAKFADNRVDPRYTDLLSKQAQSFAIDSVKKGLHFGRNVSEAYRGIQDATKLASHEIQTSGQQFGKRTKSAVSVLSSAIKNSKHILNKSEARPKGEGQYHGLGMLYNFNEWTKSTERFKGQNKVAVAGSLEKFFAETHKIGNKESILQKVFGGILQKSSIRDVVDTTQVAHILGNLENVYTKDEAHNIVQKILDIKVGDNIYQDWRNPHIKGGMVDLNFLDPIHMAKRALSPILNHQLYAPIVKSWFSLADLTGTHKWVNASPTMFTTRNKPNFKTKDGGSISDEVTNNDALYVYNKGGKWAIFDGGVVRTVDTGRSLHYAHKSGKDKSWELKDITVNRIKRLKTNETMAEYNDAKNKMDHRTQPTNKWQGFFNHIGIGMPEAISKQYNALKGKFQGKTNYRLEFDNIFGSDNSDEMLGKVSPAIPLVNHVYGHTSQVLARVARNKDALDILGHHAGNTDLADKALNDQTILEKVHKLSLDGRYRNSHDVIKAIEDMKAFPGRSRSHIVTRGVGRFQDMTSTDIVRTSYIDNVFDKSILEHSDLAITHPLLNAAPDLFSKGIITREEKNALELHAKLSVFRMRDALIPGSVNNPEILKTVLGKVRDRAKQNQWNMADELVNFVSNNDMRRPSIINSQEKILRSPIHFAHDDHPFVSTPDKGFEVVKEFAERILDRSTDVLAEWSPIKKYAFTNHGWQGNLKYLARTVGTVAAIGGAYRIVDTVTATNPLFDDTMLDEGITGAAADIAAKGRFGLSRAADITGITATAKYLHGLAPFSESALPGVLAGSMLGVFTKMSPLGIAKSALAGAIVNRVMSPYLPDMTKSHEELKEIYAGRQQVPIMKAPTWALGGTPWEGSKVVGYSPNWYVRAKSRWKETDTLYGSAFRRLIHEPLPLLGTNIGDVIDPYYMERKQYFTRPYPVTGELFKEVPLIGGILSSTIGRIIKPQKTMHQEYLTQGRMYQVQGDIPGDPYQFAVRPPTIPEGLSIMNRGSSDALSTAGMANNFGKATLMNNKYWAETGAEDFLYDVQNFAGLKGFLAGTVAERIFQTNKTVPTLESAGRIASMGRSYYDLNLGGMGVITEGIRRVIEKPEYRQYGINPIYNRMPNWLPAQFLTGDPYAKLARGELRLPGCITPETMILTEDGLRFAKNIKINDKLLTLNNFQKVEHIVPKYKNELIYKIDCYSGLPIEVTKDHHVLVIKTTQCKYHKTLESSKKRRPCKPFINKLFCKNCQNYKKYKYEWLPVKDIEEGDYLILPKIKNNKKISEIKTIDIVKKFNIELEDNNTFRYTRILNNKKVYNNKPIYFPEKIILDKELMYFAGYYLAEGSPTYSRQKISGLTLCVSLNELYILTKFSKWLKEKYNLESIIQKSNIGNYYIFYIRSCFFAKIITELFGYCKTKKINKDFNNLKYLLAGLFDGDGHISKESIILTHSKKYQYSYQLPIILLQENIPYSIREKDKDIFTTKISISKLNDFLIFKKIDKLTSNKTNTFIELEDRFLVKIKKISKLYYKGKVFDYQVENEHNYTTSFLMHNSAYLVTHTDVNRSMPARASMIGGTTENIVQYFASLTPPSQLAEYEIMEEGTEFHRSIQETLATEGMLIQAEALVQDVKNDITGHVDAIIRDGIGGKGRRALEIKTINDKAFQTLDAPKNEHYSQLNFYLRMLKMRKGTLLYINRDNPAQVKTFEINYSQTKWEKDVKKLQKARSIAKTMMEEGVGDTLGFSYSWADRLKVLADAAPNSSEFKEAKQIVEKQIKFGVADRSDVEKYTTALKQKQARIRSYELYPDRFRGKILNPDSVANIQSINEDIKAGAEYSLPERIIGAVWEKFANTNTFLTNKLFAAKDPLEHYKMTRLYGKEYKPWNEPIRGWLEPYSRGLASKTDPFAGAISFGMGGMILGGGPIPGAIAAVGGAAYGTLHGAYRFMSGTTYIPESIKEKRDIQSYFDAAKYERNNMLASLSTGLTQQEFLSQRDATLSAFNTGGKGASVANLFRGTSVFEKPYIESFLNTRNPKERERILSYVPEDLATALKKQWGTNDSKDLTINYVVKSSEELTKGAPKYKFDRSIMDPSVNLEDVKLKTVQAAGFDQFEFGLGWNEQMLRMQETNNNVQAANIQRLESSPESLGPNISQANVRGMINNLFIKDGVRSSTQVYIDNTLDINQLEFVIRRDRSRTMINALNKRDKYRI